RVRRPSGSWARVDAEAERSVYGWTGGDGPSEPGEIAWPVFEGVELRYGVSAPGHAAIEITGAPDRSTFVLERLVQVVVELPNADGEGEGPPELLRLAIEPVGGAPPPDTMFFERLEPGGDGVLLGHVSLPEGARVEIKSPVRARNGLTFVVPEGGGRVEPQRR
ncbi:MAG: hypothetical protein AAFP86_17170, partial [Planctomycetota bacterium]